MPFLKDEDVLDMHKAIDFNKNISEQWKERCDAKELEVKKLTNIKKWNQIALIGVGLLCLLLFYIALIKPFWITNNKLLASSGYHMVSLNENSRALNDINSNHKAIDSTVTKMYKGVMYQVQIGAFKHFSIPMHSKEFKYLTAYSNEYNKYALGKFATYADATTFKNDLKRLGFNEAFLVSFYNNEQIDIRKALELSGEPQFLEQ